ncbi:MAG: helix-turn-helix domain-containing protein [Treponemataceae bacterium]|nr:helix-turn-helix domain-containing protein [Treponemataceae bacterium]
MDDYSKAFRQNVKYYRRRQSVSQTELSIRCDCAIGTIGGIEAGKAKPSFDMILKIADALKVTPADLFICDISKDKAEIKRELKDQFDTMIERL